jgi:SecD/SecF fusion protein
MRNRVFFWILTGVLLAICLYQLSFTWVTSKVEKEAERKAEIEVAAVRKKAATAGDSTTLPNGTVVNFVSPEAQALAKSAYINQILKEKSDKPVYPILGTSFSDTKKRSMAFGLDLVGGMSVTLEISVPELIKSYVRNPRDLRFKRAYDKAVATYNSKGGDFISLFLQENKKINKAPVVQLLATSEIEGLGMKSSDDDVEAFFRKITSSSMDGVELIMSRRINQFGVAQPNIQRDLVNNRLYIELPGVQDESTVAAKLQSTANLQLYEIYFSKELGVQWQQASVLSTKEPATDSIAKDSTASLLSLGGTKKGLQELVKYTDLDPQKEINFMGYVMPNNKMLVEDILRRQDILDIFPEDVKFMWSDDIEEVPQNKKEKGYVLYAIKVPESGKARVGGQDIKNATPDYNNVDAEWVVNVSMSEDGTDKWAEMSSDNIGRCVAITMDDVVYSAPRVNEAITGGNTQISGTFTQEEVSDLAGLLNGGALPAPCVIKDQTKVGPTIGSENSSAGLLSFGIAFLAVLLYMYLYYSKAGLAANIALVANVIFIFGFLASFGAVLTLAGIAGIVLTIGTAVDANILIFERVREEKYRGLDDAGAISVGFKKALPSIIDANVTHLLVAVILKIFGTGEIESFATTLIIGIFTSIFSAIVISKLVITYWLDKGKGISFFTKMSEGLFQNLSFDWVGKRKYFYIFSISVTVIGVAALVTRGLKPSVEFTGGRTYVVKFQNKADIEHIRTNLSKVFVENGEVASIDLKTKSNEYNVEIVTNYLSKNDGATQKVKEKLLEGLEAGKSKTGKYEIVESRSVSASISNQLSIDSYIMIFLSLLAIFTYILIRFGYWQYSIGAIVGLIHDAFFVISVFALLHGILPFSLDVNQAFIAAILTVIGYSMNDTVIVFDRIRENLRGSKEEDNHHDIINKSLNTTLSRTFNTSMTLFVVVLIMFIFGGPAIKGFLFALLVGVVIGTYSSLCVATPILIDFSKRLKV